VRNYRMLSRVTLWVMVLFVFPLVAKAEALGRFSVADGPVSVHSFGKKFFGNDFSIGGNFEFGRDARWLAGAELNWMESNERSEDRFIGHLRRFALIHKFGFYVVPERLYVAPKVGVSFIQFGNKNDLIWMLGGLEAGGFFATLSDRFELGAAFSYTYAPEVDAGRYRTDHDATGMLPSRYITPTHTFSTRLILSFLVPPATKN
jgi:hypothetical protein